MNDDLRQEQTARINLYALISRLLMSEVDEELLKSIEADENMLSFFPSYVKWKKVKKLNLKDLREKYLNVDFTNLFLLHMTPYESFYRRDDQMMETGGENPVLQLFNEHDFRVDLGEARAVSVDHIGIELEFMYMLCDGEKRALVDGELEIASDIATIQHKFLKEHLLEWAPMFLLNVKSEAGTAFYFDTAEFALEFIMSDFEMLSEMLIDGKCKYNV